MGLWGELYVRLTIAQYRLDNRSGLK